MADVCFAPAYDAHNPQVYYRDMQGLKAAPDCFLQGLDAFETGGLQQFGKLELSEQREIHQTFKALVAAYTLDPQGQPYRLDTLPLLHATREDALRLLTYTDLNDFMAHAATNLKAFYQLCYAPSVGLSAAEQLRLKTTFNDGLQVLRHVLKTGPSRSGRTVVNPADGSSDARRGVDLADYKTPVEKARALLEQVGDFDARGRFVTDVKNIQNDDLAYCLGGGDRLAEITDVIEKLYIEMIKSGSEKEIAFELIYALSAVVLEGYSRPPRKNDLEACLRDPLANGAEGWMLASGFTRIMIIYADSIAADAELTRGTGYAAVQRVRQMRPLLKQCVLDHADGLRQAAASDVHNPALVTATEVALLRAEVLDLKLRVFEAGLLSLDSNWMLTPDEARRMMADLNTYEQRALALETRVRNATGTRDDRVTDQLFSYLYGDIRYVAARLLEDANHVTRGTFMTDPAARAAFDRMTSVAIQKDSDILRLLNDLDIPLQEGRADVGYYGPQGAYTLKDQPVYQPAASATAAQARVFMLYGLMAASSSDSYNYVWAQYEIAKFRIDRYQSSNWNDNYRQALNTIFNEVLPIGRIKFATSARENMAQGFLYNQALLSVAELFLRVQDPNIVIDVSWPQNLWDTPQASGPRSARDLWKLSQKLCEQVLDRSNSTYLQREARKWMVRSLLKLAPYDPQAIDHARDWVEQNIPAQYPYEQERAALLSEVAREAANLGYLPQAESLFQTAVTHFEKAQAYYQNHTQSKYLPLAYRRAYVSTVIAYANLEIRLQKLPQAQAVLAPVWDFSQHAPQSKVWGSGGWFNSATPQDRFERESAQFELYGAVLGFYEQAYPLQQAFNAVDPHSPQAFYPALVQAADAAALRLTSEQLLKQNPELQTVLATRWQLLKAKVLSDQPPALDAVTESNVLGQIQTILAQVLSETQNDPDLWYLKREAQQGLLRLLARSSYSAVILPEYPDSQQAMQQLYLDYGSKLTAEAQRYSGEVKSNERRAVFAGRVQMAEDMLAYQQNAMVESMLIYAVEQYYDSPGLAESPGALAKLATDEFERAKNHESGADAEGARTLVRALLALTDAYVQRGDYEHAAVFLAVLSDAQGVIKPGVQALYENQRIEAVLLEAKVLERSLILAMNRLDPLASNAGLEMYFKDTLWPQWIKLHQLQDTIKTLFAGANSDVHVTAQVQLMMLSQELLAYVSGLDPKAAEAMQLQPLAALDHLDLSNPDLAAAARVYDRLLADIDGLLASPYLAPSQRQILIARRMSLGMRRAFVEPTETKVKVAVATLVSLYLLDGQDVTRAPLHTQLSAAKLQAVLDRQARLLGPQSYRYVELEMLELLRIYVQMSEDIEATGFLEQAFLNSLSRPLPADLAAKAHINLAQLKLFSLRQLGQGEPAQVTEAAREVLQIDLATDRPVPVGLRFQYQSLQADLMALMAFKTQDDLGTQRSRAEEAWRLYDATAGLAVPGVSTLDRLKLRISQALLMGILPHSSDMSIISDILKHPDFQNFDVQDQWLYTYRLIHAMWTGPGAQAETLLQCEGKMRELLAQPGQGPQAMPFEIELAFRYDVIRLQAQLVELGASDRQPADRYRDIVAFADWLISRADGVGELPLQDLLDPMEISEIAAFLQGWQWPLSDAGHNELGVSLSVLPLEAAPEFQRVLQSLPILDEHAQQLRFKRWDYERYAGNYAAVLKDSQSELGRMSLPTDSAALHAWIEGGHVTELPRTAQTALMQILLERARVYRDRGNAGDLVQALTWYEMVLQLPVPLESQWLLLQAETEYGDLMLFSASRLPHSVNLWKQLEAARPSAQLSKAQFPRLTLQRSYEHVRWQAWVRLMVSRSGKLQKPGAATTLKIAAFEKRLLQQAHERVAPSTVSPELYQRWAEAYALTTSGDLWFAVGEAERGMHNYEQALAVLRDSELRFAYVQRLLSAYAQTPASDATTQAMLRVALDTQLLRLLADDPYHLGALRIQKQLQ